MSEVISKSSPTFGSISGDGLGFESIEDLVRAWSSSLKPDPYLTVSEWADRYRVLPSRAAAEPRRYPTRTSR